MPKLVEEHEFVLTLEELDKVKQRMAQLEKPISSNKRAKQTWTQQYLADQAHVDLSTAKRFLGRKNEMGESSFRALIQALGFNPDEFSALQSISDIGIDKIRSASKRMLEDLKRLTTEALTAGDGIRFDFDDVFVPLGVVERRERSKRKEDDGAPDRGSELYEEKVTPITHDEFFEDVLLRGNTRYSNGKRIAVIGEAGAGKTTQLQKIGSWLLEESDDIPVWISLTDLGAKSLREYLFENWVREASGEIESAPQVWKDSLGDAIKYGKVWLLLDGVDEMTVSNPLSHLSTQLNESWLKNVRVILTCRVNVWDGGKNSLTGFDIYRNLDFDYPDDVYKFIDKWFVRSPELSGSLTQALEQSGKERIRDMVKNPLRLTLLCFSWQKLQGGLPETKGGLPETKAGLYEWFVNTFYDWKREEVEKVTGVEINSSKIKELNKALGELAKAAIDSESSRFRLTETFIRNNMNPDLFDLADKLNWLNKVGDAAENSLESVYAFYHPSFQEYFAALAISNWTEFVPSQHIDKPLNNNYYNQPECKYRIFESHWKEVVLFWFGRPDVDDTRKSLFVDKLINFDDGCKENFYNYRAYCLAAICLTEFRGYKLANDIVYNIIKSTLKYFNCKNQEHRGYLHLFLESGRELLFQTRQDLVVKNLCQILANQNTNDDTCREILIVLRELSNKCQFKEESKIVLKPILYHAMQNSNSEAVRIESSVSLMNIYIDNKETSFSIKTLCRSLIKSMSEEYYSERNSCDILRYLESIITNIDIDDKEFIVIYLKLILVEYNNNEYILMDSIKILVELKPDIEIKILSIYRLIRLMSEAGHRDTRKYAARILKDIIVDNQSKKIMEDVIADSAIFTSMLNEINDSGKILNENPNPVKSTKKVEDKSTDNENINRVISELVNNLRLSNDREVLIRSTPNLIRILKETSLDLWRSVVYYLHDLIIDENRENDFVRYATCYKVIWYCAQNMSYPDFYEAWHSQPTSTHPEVTDTIPSNNTNKIQTLESQLIDREAIQKELDRNTDHPEIRCLVVDIRHLEQESDPNVIAKKLTNKIFNSIGRRIPVVQDISCLERELLNLKLEPEFEKLAIALYGKSANEAINQLCQNLASIHIYLFTGGQTTQELITNINAWLSEM